MATSSLLTLIDDIATLLDDVAAMTKVATKKTAGVLGDDLALNAKQVTGVSSHRELPVVWAVAKGSAVNKAILVPLALVISALIPWAIVPLLMIGGAFLCFEGVEKLIHTFLHKEDSKERDDLLAAARSPEDLLAFERDKIKAAVRTDFILSAEIIILTLGSAAHATFPKQVAVLCAISLIMTIGVYGLVAAIVKLDDLGLWCVSGGRNVAVRTFGRFVLTAAPILMKSLSFFGTAAMFLVGGGIITHGVGALHHAIEYSATIAQEIPTLGVIIGPLTPLVFDLVVGIVTGAVVLAGYTVVQRIYSSLRKKGV